MNGEATWGSRSRLGFWLAGLVCFFLFLYFIRGILLPFVVGMLAAYFLDPAVHQLRARGWSRSTSAAIITIAFFTITVALGSILVPLILEQLTMLASQLPIYIHALREKYGADLTRYFSSMSPELVNPIKSATNSIGGGLADMLGTILPDMLQSGLAILNMLSLIFLTPVVVFYLLRDWDHFVERIDDMLPRDHADTIRTQLRAIDSTLSGFIRGQTNVCLLMAAYYGIALTLIGLNSGLGLGILTGFLLFIPFVGYAASLVTCLIIGLFQFGWGEHIMVMLAVFGVGVVLESGFITPKLVGDKVGDRKSVV